MSEIVATLSFTKDSGPDVSMVVNILLHYVNGADFIIYEWIVRPSGEFGHLAFDNGRALVGPDPLSKASVATRNQVIYLLAPSMVKDQSFDWERLAKGKMSQNEIVGRILLPTGLTIGDLPKDGRGTALTLDGKILVRQGHESYADKWQIEGFISNNTAVFKNTG